MDVGFRMRWGVRLHSRKCAVMPKRWRRLPERQARRSNCSLIVGVTNLESAVSGQIPINKFLDIGEIESLFD